MHNTEVETLLIAIGLTVLFAGLLIFGFGTGTMPSIVPGFDAGDRSESPGRFWTLAGINLLWLAVGVFTLATAF